MDENTWIALLDEMGQNVINLRDKRYDAVIHLVTAADGNKRTYDKVLNMIFRCRIIL